MFDLRKAPLILLIVCFTAALGREQSFAQEFPGEARPRDPKMLGPENPDDKLRAEDRERIRSVLAEAWKRPEVIAARDQVHVATEKYKQALQKAVVEIDPKAEALMNQLHSTSKMEAMRHRLPPYRGEPGRGRGPKSDPEMVERSAASEPAFQTMDFEERRRFFDLAQQVLRDGAIDDELQRIRDAKEPKEMQKARSALRKTLVQAMKDKDPWAKERIEKAREKHPPSNREPEQ